MAVTQFIIIYFLAVNAFGLNGESAKLPAPPSATTTMSAHFTKSVIKNSSSTTNALLNKQTEIIVTHAKKMPNGLPQSAQSLNDETTVTERNNLVKTSTSDNYNNEKNTKLAAAAAVAAAPTNFTSNNGGPLANAKADYMEKCAKNASTLETISKRRDSNENDTETPSNSVATVATTETDNDTRVQTAQLKTLPPINEEKILLTGNSHNEQLNNGVRWNGSSAYNGSNVPRSVSNSIITITTTALSARDETVSLAANSTKMTEMRSKTIEPFTSIMENVRNEKTTPNYITRAASKRPYETSSASLLSATDKRNKAETDTETETETETDTETVTETLVRHSPANSAENIEIKLMNRPNTSNDFIHSNNSKHKTNQKHDGNLHEIPKLRANVTTNKAIDAVKLLTDYTSSSSESNISIESNRRILDTDDTMPTKSNEFIIDLNRSTVDTSVTSKQPQPTTTTSITTKVVTAMTTTSAAHENYFNETKKTFLQFQRKIFQSAASQLIRANANENENENDMAVEHDEHDGRTNETTLVNKRTFVFDLTNETTISNAKYAIDENSSNKSHENNSMRLKSVHHQTLNRNESKHSAHNDSTSTTTTNEAQIPMAQVWLENCNSSATPNGFVNMMQGKKNQSPNSADISSQPLEITNTSSSSKLMMPSLFVDEENNFDHIAATEAVLETRSNVSTTVVDNESHDIEEQFTRSQYGTNNLSTIIPAEYRAQNINKDAHDFRVISTINSADGYFKLLENDRNDNKRRQQSIFASSAHFSLNDAPFEGKNVNNFLSAAITAEHEIGNQLAIDDSNSNDTTNSTNDRCANQFIQIHDVKYGANRFRNKKKLKIV